MDTIRIERLLLGKGSTWLLTAMYLWTKFEFSPDTTRPVVSYDQQPNTALESLGRSVKKIYYQQLQDLTFADKTGNSSRSPHSHTA
jgi:hypothetical protein